MNIREIALVFPKREVQESLYYLPSPQFLSDSNAFLNENKDKPRGHKAKSKMKIECESATDVMTENNRSMGCVRRIRFYQETKLWNSPSFSLTFNQKFIFPNFLRP